MTIFHLIGYIVLFILVFDLIANIVQIPFAIIGRKAVYAVAILEWYCIALFSSILTRAFCEDHTPGWLIVLAVFIIILAQGIAKAYGQNKRENTIGSDNDRSVFMLFGAIGCAIAFVILYLTKITFLSEVVLWFAKLIEWASSVPVLSTIMKVYCYVGTIVIIGYSLFVSFAMLIAVVMKKN